MTTFIFHEPLLGPGLFVEAYEISFQQQDTNNPSDSDMEMLLTTLAENLVSPNKSWLLHETKLFLNVTPSLLSASSLKLLPPDKIVLSLDGADLQNGEARASIIECRKQGFEISLRNISPDLIDDELLPYVTNLEVDCSRSNTDSAANIYGFRKLLPLAKIIGKDIDCWNECATCSMSCLDLFPGNYFLKNRPSDKTKELDSTQSTILQGVNLLNNDADVGMVEKELKRDPAITYKLLQYINSATFGLGTEITSLRQAVNYLGYSIVKRLLCLSLATSSKVENASILLEAAIIRGRFVELLGHKRLAHNDADQLFIAGIFSLLDRLLGMPMEEVLKQVHLSEAVQQALLTRSGIFGQYLTLAESCELKHGSTMEIASSLRISAHMLNTAQLRALIWAQQIQK